MIPGSEYSMLEVRNKEFEYPLASISADFSVSSGETVALMGPSGSGKSTILNIIAGLAQPERGDVRFDNHSLLRMAPSERPLSYLFQSNNLFPHLTVWQNIAIGLYPGMRTTPEQNVAIEQALDWVSLEGYQKRKPDSLSGGQQQFGALARWRAR